AAGFVGGGNAFDGLVDAGAEARHGIFDLPPEFVVAIAMNGLIGIFLRDEVTLPVVTVFGALVGPVPTIPERGVAVVAHGVDLGPEQVPACHSGVLQGGAVDPAGHLIAGFLINEGEGRDPTVGGVGVEDDAFAVVAAVQAGRVAIAT